MLRCGCISREATIKWEISNENRSLHKSVEAGGFHPTFPSGARRGGGVSSWKTAGGRGAVCSAERVHTTLLTWVRKEQQLVFLQQTALG